MTKLDLDSTIQFYIDWDVFNKYLDSPEDAKKCLGNLEAISDIENNVKMWMKSMERVKIVNNVFIPQFIKE